MKLEIFGKQFSFEVANTTINEAMTHFFGRNYPRSQRFTRANNNKNALEAAAVGLLYTCINEHAKAASKLPLVKQKTSQIDSRLLPNDHRAVKFFTQPNPVFTQQEYYPMITKWLRITGNCYIFAPDFNLGFPMQQWILDPHRVTTVFGTGSDLIAGYELWGQGGTLFIPESQMIHIRTLEPNNKINGALVGTGLVEAALKNANIDLDIQDFLGRYFLNDARPPAVAIDEGNVFANDKDKWELYKNEWNSRLPNNKLYALLKGGMKVENLDGSSIDVDYDKVHELNRQAISEIFGLPLDLLNGKLNGKAVTRDIISRFHTSTINPLLQLIDAAYTKHLQRYDYTISVEHELYVDDDPDEKRLQELHELTTGQTTINELRAKQGKMPIKDGDTIFVPSGAQTLKKALETPQPLFAPHLNIEPEKKKFSFNVVRSEEEKPEFDKDVIWRSFDTLTQKKAHTLQGIISDVFSDLEKEILGNVSKRYDGEVVKVGVDSISDLFDLDTWVKKIEDATGETLTILQRDAIAKALETVGSNLDAMPSAFSEEMAKALEDSIKKISDSIGTIKDEVGSLLKDNTDATASELKDLLTAKFDTLKVSRAEAIAKTSANYTTTGAQKKTWTNLGITTTWLSQRDGVTRGTHLAADGTQPDESGMFTVGGDRMPHPCGGSLAEENVNCRCGLFPQRKKKA